MRKAANIRPKGGRAPKFASLSGKAIGERVLVHISPVEKKAFERAAKDAEMSRSDWMRDCCLIALGKDLSK